jgi:hypothetical protein
MRRIKQPPLVIEKMNRQHFFRRCVIGYKQQPASIAPHRSFENTPRDNRTGWTPRYPDVTAGSVVSG